MKSVTKFWKKYQIPIKKAEKKDPKYIQVDQKALGHSHQHISIRPAPAWFRTNMYHHTKGELNPLKGLQIMRSWKLKHKLLTWKFYIHLGGGDGCALDLGPVYLIIPNMNPIQL